MKILTRKEVIVNSILRHLTSKGLTANTVLLTAIQGMKVDPNELSKHSFDKSVQLSHAVPMKDRLLLRQLYEYHGWDLTFYGSEESDPCEVDIQVGQWIPM